MSKPRGLFDFGMDNVVYEISPDDDMFQGNREHYLRVGISAVECIRLAIDSGRKGFADIKNILDLPCGYGRVLRMLKVAFPGAKLTACDLDCKAVDFCRRAFGADPILSDKQIKNVRATKTFDLVWCGSLLTHVDSPRWHDFLEFFRDVLEPGGILVVTTHGEYVAEVIRNNKCNYGIEDASKLKNMLREFDASGFGYSDYFHSDDYGISICSRSYALDLLKKHGGLRLVSYLDRGWDDHQDVIACVKESG